VVVTRLCLDTSAYSHFKRGDAAVRAAITSARWVGVPTVVLGELRTGFALGKRRDDLEQELQTFLDHPVVHVLAVDDTASRHYAQLVVALRRAGTSLPTNDIWIASVAQRESATVLTYDAHFRAIEQVACRVLAPS
jgi:tRNA(fMet)-specific endonuclease VapC